MIGQTVAHYRILERLGCGGMGVVYKANDTRLKRTVALKFLPPHLTSNPEARERFIHEAQAASALDHPNICDVHDIGETAEGQTYIVMACYEGETLQKKIERGPLKIEGAIDFVQQIAQGLAKAHEHGIVHRDMKPANVMVTPDGVVKILDFGVAKLSGRTLLTRVGSTPGTLAYMSPEQARGDEVDHRSDIWSVGVVLYEMIAGHLPFKSEYEQALVYSLLNEEPQPVPGIDPRLDRIIRKAMRKDSSARYQHIGELQSDLRQFKEKDGRLAREGPPLETPRSVKKGMVVLPTVILFGAIVALVAYFMGGPDEDEIVSTEQRLVVLPFENLGPPDNEFFADGMTEELTGRLSSLSGLRVISRTSAVQYVKTNKPMEQIGRELDVDFALEGAVRWAPAGDSSSRVRINASLTRISDMTTLWTETYDRVIDDIFALQTELSRKVVEKLGITLLEPERRSVEAHPTRNLEAYQAFLRARYYRSRPHFTVANSHQAIAAYQQAVQLDTTFALAFSELARAHARLYYLWEDYSPGRLEMATHAAERAVALAPDMPGVRLAIGYYYLYAGRDTRKALEQFDMAEKGMPHNVDILEARYARASMEGRWEEALESAREAFALSPRDGSLGVDLAEIYWVLRKHEQAVKTCDLAIELTPDDAWPYLMKTFTLWGWKGASTETRTLLEAVPANHDWWPWAWYWQEMFQRNYRQAIGRLSSSPGIWIRTKCWAMPKSLLIAFAQRLLGEQVESRQSFESAKTLLQAEVKKHPDDPRYHSSLGIAYAALGQETTAIREGKRAVELLPVAADAFYGLPYVEDLSFIYALSGDAEAAVDRLDYLLSIPSWTSVVWIKTHPQWDSIRDHPMFKKLLEKHAGVDR